MCSEFLQKHYHKVIQYFCNISSLYQQVETDWYHHIETLLKWPNFGIWLVKYTLVIWPINYLDCYHVVSNGSHGDKLNLTSFYFFNQSFGCANVSYGFLRRQPHSADANPFRRSLSRGSTFPRDTHRVSPFRFLKDFSNYYTWYHFSKLSWKVISMRKNV